MTTRKPDRTWNDYTEWPCGALVFGAAWLNENSITVHEQMVKYRSRGRRDTMMFKRVTFDNTGPFTQVRYRTRNGAYRSIANLLRLVGTLSLSESQRLVTEHLFDSDGDFGFELASHMWPLLPMVNNEPLHSLNYIPLPFRRNNLDDFVNEGIGKRNNKRAVKRTVGQALKDADVSKLLVMLSLPKSMRYEHILDVMQRTETWPSPLRPLRALYRDPERAYTIARNGWPVDNQGNPYHMSRLTMNLDGYTSLQQAYEATYVRRYAPQRGEYVPRMGGYLESRYENKPIEYADSILKIEKDFAEIGWTVRLPRDTDTMKQWGNEQGHCIGGYWNDARLGIYYFFEIDTSAGKSHAQISAKNPEIVQHYSKRNSAPPALNQEIAKSLVRKLSYA